MSVFEAVLLAIVEGITEFLPISSTGHMILTSSLLGIAADEFTKNFTVIIQFGAILSVLVLYWNRFLQSVDFYTKLLIAFLPAAVFGFFLNDFVDSLLENVIVVAVTLLMGGIFLLYLDKLFPPKDIKEDEQQPITYPSAFKIGLFQVIAMIPGVSRSAATIVGGLSQGLSRKNAAEFSFFLAVPTMFAATCYKLLKMYKTIQPEQINVLLIGNVVAFVVALIAIKSFIGFVTKNGLRVFGYYRIALGLVIIVLYLLGIPLQIV